MSQMMFFHDFAAIIRRVPGLRLACNDWRNKRLRTNWAIPEVGVYYGDRFVVKADQDFMDEVPHVEDWSGKGTWHGEHVPSVAEAYRRSAWPAVMRVIEDHIPPHRRPLLRKAARRYGFRWWRN